MHAGARFLTWNCLVLAIALLLPPGSAYASVAFERSTVATGEAFTTLAIGPDGRLYAATLWGDIMRYDIDSGTGALSGATRIETVRNSHGENRSLIGIAFEPGSTAEEPVLWVADNEIWSEDASPWSGEIARLTGADLGTLDQIVVNLPRSRFEHMTNGIAFGPDGALYILQGSNTGSGAPDAFWHFREERLLSAAVLRLDLGLLGDTPIDVRTEGEGDVFDPFAPGAALTIFATGVRNGYDLVWTASGRLYATANGSKSNGNAPGTPEVLPAACATSRIDLAENGAYTGPEVPAAANLPLAQEDFLFHIEEGGFYGHPNPLRCEWVLNGGNPTAELDPGEIAAYPEGVLPDRNWRGFAYDFGIHQSANGILEYQSAHAAPQLAGKLMVARFSQGDDVIVLTVDETTGQVTDAEIGIPGLTGILDPLDLLENPTNGDLYLIQFSTVAGRIHHLRPSSSDFVFGDGFEVGDTGRWSGTG